MKSYSAYNLLIIFVYLSIFLSVIYIFSISINPLYFIGISLILIGIVQDIKNMYLPRIVVNILAVVSVIIIFALSFNIMALFDFAKNVVITFLGIKSLEKKQPRDIYQILILEAMAIGMVGVANASIEFLFMLLIWLFLSIWIFLATNVYKSLKNERIYINQFKTMNYMVLAMSISTIITGLFIFLFMPRIRSPLLNLGVGGIQNTVGFSSTLNPSNATNVLENTATVFRILNIKGNIDVKNAYFIGETLDYYNGISWNHKNRARGEILLKGPMVRYTIMIEPSYDYRLFSIAYPYSVFIYKSPILAHITEDLTIKTSKPILHRLVYRVFSHYGKMYQQNLKNPQDFLQLPDDINPSIIRLANMLKDQNQNPIQSVKNYFKQEHFKYSLSNISSKDFMYDFLFKNRVGNCEAYASATALLLRLMGVPARVVVGFHGAFYNKDGNYYFVTNSLAHSWVEVYYNGYWQLVDTTPSSYTTTIPKLSKIRMLADYISYLWDINVVYYSQARQHYLIKSLIQYIKHFIQIDLKYVFIFLSLISLMYLAFKKIIVFFSIRVMYKDLCYNIKKVVDIDHCYPEKLPQFIVENGFGDFFNIYIKAKYSGEKISKKELRLARKYYKNTLKTIKESSVIKSLS